MQLFAMLGLPIGWAQPLGPHHGIVFASRARLARNLAGHHFPARASSEALDQVLGEVFRAASGVLNDAAFLKLSDLDAVDRRFLVERHLVSPDLAATPRSRGVAVAMRETLSLMVNEEDHLRLSALKPGLRLRESYQEADRVESALKNTLHFAFKEGLGFLTACPTNLGTGLRASVLMHLPALAASGRIAAVLENLPRLGLNARGLYGEGTKVMGDFYQIANAGAFGRSEEEIILGVEKAASDIAELETRARREILGVGPGRISRIEDSIHRSAGILTNARLISFEEACAHLSFLRLGHADGFKDLPGNLGKTNELLISTQPAHLAMRARKDLNAEERDFLRARLLRESLGSR